MRTSNFSAHPFMSARGNNSAAETPAFLFLTDFPPLVKKAISNHGIAANFIRIMRERFVLVVTHRFRRSISLKQVSFDFPDARFFFYPDAGGWGAKKISPGLADAADIFLCLLALPGLRRAVREAAPDRLFVLVGASAWFLIIAWMVSAATGLPMDIYLVDDLRQSARLARRHLLQFLAPSLEKWVLRRASRIFVIAPGYADHLKELYGVSAQWLPSPIYAESIAHHQYQVESPDIRTILFIGANNDLYLESLVDLYHAIQEWNLRSTRYRLRMRMLSPDGGDRVKARLPNTNDLEVRINLPPEELAREARTCWATFLCYSFAASVRTMVATSFSWKLNDSYRSGRPILVYGPEYASIPRYFREAELPLVAQSRQELTQAISDIEVFDGPELIERYRETWRRYHSSEAIIRKLSVVENAAT
jgi:hypothetical protein